MASTSQTSTRASSPAPKGKDTTALAAQAAESRVGRAETVDADTLAARRAVGAPDKPAAAGKAAPDDADTARKAYAKKTGAKLFPEHKPEEGQIVMANKANRVGSTSFMAQYKSMSPTGADGAFYSNLNGTYSMLEGEVDSWVEWP